MRKPIFVRPLSDDERQSLEEGLRSSDAFVLRRCQILLASYRGEHASRIARALGCNSQSVRNAIHAFNEGGFQQALSKGSSRPHTTHPAFGPERAERLREMLHRSPREFGKPTSLWTLELAAEVSFEEGLSEGRVAGETIRATLERLGVRWLRGKRWIICPDPEYARKKAPRPADQVGCRAPGGVGSGFRRRVLVEPAGPALVARLERGGESHAAGATLGE